MSEFVDWYEILQVHPSAEPEVIKGAYDKLAKKYHPDLNKDPAATERMKQINLAYEILSDRDKRRQFDSERHGRQSKADPSEARDQAAPIRPSSPAPPQRQLKGWSKWVVGSGFSATLVLVVWGMVIVSGSQTPLSHVKASVSTGSKMVANSTSTPTSTPTFIPTPTPLIATMPPPTPTPAATSTAPPTPMAIVLPSHIPTPTFVPSVTPTPRPGPTPTPIPIVLWKQQVGMVGKPASAVAMSADGSLIVVGSQDMSVYALDRQGKLLWEHPTEGAVQGVAISGDGLLVAVNPGGGVHLLDREGTETGRRGSGYVAISADGSRLAIGRSVFDRRGNLLWTYPDSDNFLALSSNGSYVATRDGRLLDGKGQMLWRYPLGFGPTAISGDGSYVAIGNTNRNLLFLDKQGRLLWHRQVSKAGNEIRGVAMSADALVVAAYEQRRLYLFDWQGNLLWEYGTGDNINGVAMSADGSLVAIAFQVAEKDKVSGYVHLLSGPKPTPSPPPKPLYSPTLLRKIQGSGTVAMTPDGSYVAIGGDSYIFVYDRQGTKVRTLQQSAASGIALSADASYMALAKGVFDDKGKWVLDYAAFGVGNPTAVAVSADGSLVAVAGGYVYLLERSGKLLWKSTVGANSLAMTPDGSYVAAAASPPGGVTTGVVYLYNRQGDLLWQYKVNENITKVSMSADGAFVTAGSYLIDREGNLVRRLSESSSPAVVLGDDSLIAGTFSRRVNDRGDTKGGVYVMDQQGTVLWWSEEASEIKAWSADRSLFAASCTESTPWGPSQNVCLFNNPPLMSHPPKRVPLPLPWADDFNGGKLDTSHWQMMPVKGDAEVVVANDRLEMAINSNQFSEAGVYTILPAGDFDVRVDYGLIQWANEDVENIGVVLWAPWAEHKETYVGIVRSYDTAAARRRGLEGGNIYLYDAFRPGKVAWTETADTKGSLRLVREGAKPPWKEGTIVLTGYYLGSKGWVSTGTMTFTPGEVELQLTVWNDFNGTGTLRVFFDNFRIENLP